MKAVRSIFAAILFMLPLFAEAAVWNADNFPVVYLQDSRRHVCDPDNVLSPAVRDSVDALLSALEAKRGVQSIFAVAKRIEGGEPYDFGMALARKYKVGSGKQNSGLVVVLSTEDRAYQILTGHGLEGTLPDAVCHKIEEDYMVPFMKQGDWDAAMLNGAKAICAYVAKDETLLPESKDGDDTAEMAVALIIVAFLVVFVVFVLKGKWNSDLCPKCGHHSLKRTSQTLRRTGDGKLLVIYKCSKCGHTVAKEENDDGGEGGGMSPLLPFLFLGGSRGGGFGSGGGVSGGTFGGGTFGGGGAGGRF